MAGKYDTAKLLAEKHQEILERWIETHLANEAVREDRISREALRQQSQEFLDALTKALAHGDVKNIEGPEFAEVRRILAEISANWAKQGFSPSETATFLFSLKDAIFPILQAHYQQQPDLLGREVVQLMRLVDKFGLIIFETFVKNREQVIARQQEELLELSTPVIRIWEGILVMPLIGTLDSARAQVVMDNLLHELVNTGATVAILDISGVPVMDTMVAQNLMKTITAAALMGAECIISGIRPSIAQTIVHLGIDLEAVNTKSSLVAALQHAFEKLHLRVVSKNPGEGRISSGTYSRPEGR